MSAEPRTCVGRFSTDLGGSFTLVGGDQRFDYVTIEESAKSAGQSVASLWESRLGAIRGQRMPRGRDRIIIREETLGPAAKGVWYYGNALVPDEVTLAALLDAGSTTVWLKMFAFEGKEPLLKEIVLDVANAYRPDHAAAGPDSFCLALGRVLLPYRTMERVSRRLEDRARGLVLLIDMESTLEPERAALSERLRNVQSAAAGAGAQIDKLRGGARRVAGMQGEEIVLRLRDKKQRSSLSFGWLFPGEADSGLKPKVLVRMSGPDRDLADATRTWDEILNTFRRHGEK